MHKNERTMHKKWVTQKWETCMDEKAHYICPK